MNDAAKTIETTFRELAAEFLVYAKEMRVECRRAGGLVTLVAMPHKSDMGKLLGTKAVMRHSMIAILGAVAKRDGLEFHYKIAEPTFGERQHEPPFEADPFWPRLEIGRLFEMTCLRLFSHAFDWRFEDAAGRTTIRLQIDARERRAAFDDAFEDGLSRVFNAIGQAKGRNITVKLERKGKNERAEIQPQPAAA